MKVTPLTVITIVAVLVLVVIAAAVISNMRVASRENTEAPAKKHVEEQAEKSCSLKIVAVNKTAIYNVEGCTIKLYSNDTFTVLWVAVPYKIEDGKIMLKIGTENPVSAIFEYAPAGKRVNGTRIAVPLKASSRITLAISNGAIREVYMSDEPVGRAISPYILSGLRSSSLLKITMWGPWGVNTTITFLNATKT